MPGINPKACWTRMLFRRASLQSAESHSTAIHPHPAPTLPLRKTDRTISRPYRTTSRRRVAVPAFRESAHQDLPALAPSQEPYSAHLSVMQTNHWEAKPKATDSSGKVPNDSKGFDSNCKFPYTSLQYNFKSLYLHTLSIYIFDSFTYVIAMSAYLDPCLQH